MIPPRKSHTLAASVLLASSLMTAAPMIETAQAQQAIPLQAAPVFTTPVPEEQKLGPVASPAFQQDLVEDKRDTPLPPDGIELKAIEFQGNQYFRDSVIEKDLKRLFLDQGDTSLLSPEVLEERLKQFNLTSKYKLKATILDGTTSNTGKLHLDVYERQPWQIVGTVDNQGRPGIGTLRGGVALINENLLGYGDRLLIQSIGASGTRFISGTYDYTLSPRDTLSFHSEFTHHEFDTIGPENLRGEQYGFSLRRFHTFDAKRVWTGDIGLMVRHIQVNNGAVDPRFLIAGLRYNKPDQYGLTNIYLQTFLGGEVFGGDSKFWRVRVQANRSIKLPQDNSLLLRVAGQYSPDALIPVQMFPMAGAYLTRGYSEGVLHSDSGIFASIEHYWPIPFMGCINRELSQRLRGVTFVDFSHGWLRSTRNRPVGETSIAAAGIGLRYRINQYLQGFVDLAFGLGKHENFAWQNLEGLNLNSQSRIHFGIRSNLLPSAPFKTRQTDINIL